MRKKYGKIATMNGSTIYHQMNTTKINIFVNTANCGATAICTDRKYMVIMLPNFLNGPTFGVA